MKKTAFILFVFLIFWADALYASDRDVRRLIGRRITVVSNGVLYTAVHAIVR